MSNIFNRVKSVKYPTSVFDLSRTEYGSFMPGYMYPVLVEKIAPGDVIQLGSNPFLRSQPTLAPLLNNVNVDIRYFYCRNQLLWNNFDEYITNQRREGSTAPPNHVHPQLPEFQQASTKWVFSGGSTSLQAILLDWIHGCTGGQIYANLDSLPLRMYLRIYNEYYADEFVNQKPTVPVGDGVESASQFGQYVLKSANFKRDYFTSALPFRQVGSPVTLENLVRWNGSDQVVRSSITTDPDPGNVKVSGTPLIGQQHPALVDSTSAHSVNIDPNGSYEVSIDINDLRRASAVQRFLERSACNGNRYAEFILSQYGVRIPDNSSYRPQYLGGGTSFVNYVPVEQTSGTVSGSTPQGTLAGKGTLNGLCGINHNYLFTEHGWLMAIMVIRPDTVYTQGLRRHAIVGKDRFDNYMFPMLQNIGMEAVYKDQCSAGSYQHEVNDGNREILGYTERYMSWKTAINRAHGEFKADADSENAFHPGSLSYWMALREFIGNNNIPSLNATFLRADENVMKYNQSVKDYPYFFGYIHHNLHIRRTLQYHANYEIR